MEKQKSCAEKSRNGGTFWGKPNRVAIFLVAVLLVDILLGAALLAGGYYYMGGDLFNYYEACQERAVLAESAEKAILNAADTTPIDLGGVKKEAEKVDNKIQTLAEKTDLGEYLAMEDLTTEGREHNKVVMYSIFAMFVVGVLYLLMQLGIVVVFIAKACGKNTNSNQGGAAA